MKRNKSLSPYKLKLLAYEEHTRPMRWLRWFIAVLPIGIAMSIGKIFGIINTSLNIITSNNIDLGYLYFIAIAFLCCLDTITIVFQCKILLTIKNTDEQAYKSIKMFFCWLPIPCVIGTITWLLIYLNASIPTDMLYGFILNNVGTIITYSIYSVLNIVYFKKRKDFFLPQKIFSEDNTEANNLEYTQLSLVDSLQQTTDPNINNDNEHSFDTHYENTQRKRKFCSKCGALIDEKSKKCQGCGKQYFNLKHFKKVVLPIFVFILIMSNVFLGISLYEANSSREQWRDEYHAAIDKLNFYENNIVIVYDDDSNLYHKYGCNNHSSTRFWAFNKETAVGRGFQQCPKCKPIYIK